ncbi:C-type lectin domain family 4 member E-like [Oreochromis aureus]|uniref:C-type lectin domain-containing protein n=1 Tax=Oreochromis aureus TaxID=47969 RepID=A0AAZ1Y162_OREAU|nr:C-type lectin domain family 4 member E-like [Oreochromis aureus]XP_039455850.1 C-type lectin domain family 4 member E-like [Oreochromis aureus]XP_039455851.1 C-type lectin domain family 4 member E-like [Oreochromis aureus]
MEEIYVNERYVKPANKPSIKNPTAPRSYKRSFYLVVILSLGLLAGLLTLAFYYKNSLQDSAEYLSMSNKLSSITEERELLNANVSAVSNQLSSMTEERDLLKANLTEMTKEMERLQSLFNQNKACPAGWSKFSCSCYLLSERSASWDAARKNCRDRGADLMVIDTPEEQMILSVIITEDAWIGLNDKEKEGTWKWVDGTPLTLRYWAGDQPDNGGGLEDCAHIINNNKKSWNDLPCSTSLKWICEKIP